MTKEALFKLGTLIMAVRYSGENTSLVEVRYAGEKPREAGYLVEFEGRTFCACLEVHEGEHMLAFTY